MLGPVVPCDTPYPDLIMEDTVTCRHYIISHLNENSWCNRCYANTFLDFLIDICPGCFHRTVGGRQLEFAIALEKMSQADVPNVEPRSRDAAPRQPVARTRPSNTAREEHTEQVSEHPPAVEQARVERNDPHHASARTTEIARYVAARYARATLPGDATQAQAQARADRLLPQVLARQRQAQARESQSANVPTTTEIRLTEESMLPEVAVKEEGASDSSEQLEHSERLRRDCLSRQEPQTQVLRRDSHVEEESQS